MHNLHNRSASLSVVLVDDHQLFRDALTAILETHEGIRVVAGAGTTDQALQAVRTHRPEIILLDIHLGKSSGLDCIEPIRQASPETRIILLTADESDELLRKGLLKGVDGYLLKTLPATQLICTLYEALAGTLSLPTPSLPPTSHRCPQPTPREREILHWLAQGKTNPEISILLAISENTVKVHVRNLMEKFGVNNRVLLAAAALKQGHYPSTFANNWN